MAEEALDAAGIAHERYSVSSSNEIQQVIESIVGKVDAIYTPTDNTIAAGMATVSMVANENKLPVIVGCDTMVEDGGLASYSINYYDLGYKAGEMAVEILTEGADPAEMPIEYLAAEDCQLIANQATATRSASISPALRTPRSSSTRHVSASCAGARRQGPGSHPFPHGQRDNKRRQP